MSHFKSELRRFGLSGEDLGKDTIFGGPIIVCRQRCGFLLREIVVRERIRVGDQVVTNEKEEVRLRILNHELHTDWHSEVGVASKAGKIRIPILWLLHGKRPSKLLNGRMKFIGLNSQHDVQIAFGQCTGDRGGTDMMNLNLRQRSSDSQAHPRQHVGCSRRKIV